MNLLLLHPDELSGPEVTLRERRAKHIIDVLKATPGDCLRAAIENTGTVAAEVVSQSRDTVTLRIGEPTPQPRPRTTLIVALPRPKVVSRVIAAAASFGLAKLIFVNAWRVEKSYYASPRLQSKRIEEDLRLGCEQGAQCWIPEWEIWSRFTALLEPRAFSGRSLSEGDCPETKIVLHPGATENLASLLMGQTRALECPLTLVLGPEGGWIAREQASLLEAGYVAADLGTGPLKTEVAVAAGLGQLALIRSFSSLGLQAKLGE